MGMTLNIDKTKVIIIKSQNVTYVKFMYDNNNLEEVTNILEYIFITSLTGAIALKK